MNKYSAVYPLSLAALCLAASTSAFADNYRQQQDYSGWSWSGNVDHISIKNDVANRPDIQIGSQATALGLAAEYFTSSSEMTYSVGLNYIMYNDNNEFYQYVDNYWNGTSYQQSDANAMMLYVEAGPKYRLGADGMSFFTARAGGSWIFDSTRSISNCSDCYSEDLNINGGLYGTLGIGHNFGNVEISLQFQQYFTGDLDNSVRLKVSSSF